MWHTGHVFVLYLFCSVLYSLWHIVHPVATLTAFGCMGCIIIYMYLHV